MFRRVLKATSINRVALNTQTRCVHSAVRNKDLYYLKELEAENDRYNFLSPLPTSTH